jgi:hypothetical protein
MTGMSEAILPIVAGTEFSLPFAPLGGESIVPEQSFHYVEPQKEFPQWEQFGEYPQSLASVAKSLGERIEKSAVASGFEKTTKETKSADAYTPFKPLEGYPGEIESSKENLKPVISLGSRTAERFETKPSESPRVETPEYVEAKEIEKPFSIKDVQAPRIEMAKTPEVRTPESPRIETPESAESKEIEKSVAIKDIEAPRVEMAKTPEVRTPESPLSGERNTGFAQESKSPVAETPKETRASGFDFVRVQKTENASARIFESSSAQVSGKSNVQELEKPDIQAFDTTALRMPENVRVQTTERAIVTRLVETVVETIAVTPALSSGGDGEIFIRLKPDILDGSSVRIEVKDGELKVVVVPASRVAEEILQKAQETFQNQLAERVTAWRVNVGVAAFDLRHNGRNKLEEES